MLLLLLYAPSNIFLFYSFIHSFLNITNNAPFHILLIGRYILLQFHFYTANPSHPVPVPLFFQSVFVFRISFNMNKEYDSILLYSTLFGLCVCMLFSSTSNPPHTVTYQTFISVAYIGNRTRLFVFQNKYGLLWYCQYYCHYAMSVSKIFTSHTGICVLRYANESLEQQMRKPSHKMRTVNDFILNKSCYFSDHFDAFQVEEESTTHCMLCSI